MKKRIRAWWDRPNSASSLKSVGSAMESLERRVLMSSAPVVTTVLADNRGQATLTFSRALDPTTVNTSTVRILTSGPDGFLDTADDVAQTETVQYAGNTIIATATLAAGKHYRVQVTTGVMGANHVALSGNSGKKGRGGDFDVETTEQIFIAHFSTVVGGMNVSLAQNTPITNANFLKYANAAAWDNTFFESNPLNGAGQKSNFYLQGGSFKITGSDQYDLNTSFGAIKNEPGNHNNLGTLAMAKGSTGTNLANTATNSFLFNLGDNRSRLDNANGGYTVFGAITDKHGLAVLNLLTKNFPVQNESSLLTSSNTTTAALTDPSNRLANAVTQLPVNSSDTITSTGVLDPQRDSVVISRVAMLMLTKATRLVGPVITPAAARAGIGNDIVNRADFKGALTGGSIFAHRDQT